MAILKIPVTKAGNRPIEVDTDTLPEAMYMLAMEEGLKVLLNKGMSKITTKGLEGDALTEAQDAAYAKAQENHESIKSGKVRKGRASSAKSKVPGVVMTEARRLAKEVVKNEIRAAGMKISHVPASEITKVANEMIASDPQWIEQATANIEARTVIKSGLNIANLIHESPKLVEKAKAEKAAAISAKQAGIVKPRQARAGSPRQGV